MTWENTSEGQITQIKNIHFWTKWHLFHYKFQVLLIPLALIHYQDNKTVKYTQIENNLFSFESFIVCQQSLNHICQTS